MGSLSDRWQQRMSARNAGEPSGVARKRPAWGPQEYLTYGIVGGVIAGIVVGIGLSTGDGWEFFGLIFALIAGAWFTIGTVAQGVVVGMREHRREEQGGRL